MSKNKKQALAVSPVKKDNLPPDRIRCKCVSPFQDEKYGKGVRVYTFGIKLKEKRCTVCGSKQSGL